MADEITNEALDEAAGLLEKAEIKGEVDEIKTDDLEKKTDTPPEEINFEDLIEKVKNDLKSDIGRNRGYIDKKIEDITGQIESLVGLFQQQQTQQEDFEGGFPATKEERIKEFEEYLRTKNQTQQKVDREYEDGYLKKFKSLASEYDPKVGKALDTIMREKFNIRHSDNPTVDAELNFTKAKMYLMEQAAGRKKNPLKGAQEGTLFGAAAGSENDTSVGRKIELDEYALDFQKRTGMKDEDVQKALSGGLPTYIEGAFRAAGKL